jgi:hypothetical protein
VSYRKRQRVLRTRRVAVGVRCSESCRARGTAQFLRSGIRKRLDIKGVFVQTGPGSTRKLVLRVGPITAKRLARELRRGRTVRAIVRLSALDAAGNAAAPRTVVVRVLR